jgi:hypothetical protein
MGAGLQLLSHKYIPFSETRWVFTHEMFFKIIKQFEAGEP